MNVTIISKKTGLETTLPSEQWEAMKERGDDRKFTVKKTIMQPPSEAVKANTKAKQVKEVETPVEGYDNDL